MLQQVPAGPPGYRLRRVILTNFWLYEHQEFEIPHGRLFLAGDNRSGKSTVLTAAITLALDGDYHPERIDTFGKREKRIDYYILGGLESQTPYQRDNRTTYIAMEFEWCDPDHPPFASELRARWERGEREEACFLTIGLAFHGNRNSASPISVLRFLITDGKRLEHDIPTLIETGTTRHACDLKSFKKQLAEHGIACNTQHEYEQKVASYLFNFSHVNDFRRLIRQLLYVRQPNISTILSLETVREFLDQALPALPDDLIQKAASTLEIMESLKEEIERRRSAFAAVERLHQAQQIVTMAHARLKACEYLEAQARADETGASVQRLGRAIRRAETDRQHASTQIAQLEEEQSSVEGQLAALEDSQSLQAVQRIGELRTRVLDLQNTLQDHQETLDNCIRHREQTSERIQEQEQAFEQARTRSQQLLATLHATANEQARWSLAAEQLAEQLSEVRALTSEASSLGLSAQVSCLQDVPVQERLKWLQALKQLHQELARVSTQLQMAYQQEAAAYDVLDEATRNFGQAREQLRSAQQERAAQLDALLNASAWQDSFRQIYDRASFTWDEAGLPPDELVTGLRAIQQEYAGSIGRTLDALALELGSLQTRIEEMKGERALKGEALAQARAAYEQKRQEAEYLPPRSEHRRRARERLEAAGIRALPLYMLLDFAPPLASQSPTAGGLEYLLEDAGLLDALIVLPEQQVAAQALLGAEGLSDCFLERGRLSHLAAHQPQPQQALLRVDPALRETAGVTDIWEEIAQEIVETLEHSVYPDLARQKTWSHGLLRGSAGEGTACCIGKATRVREKQRELEILHQRCTRLESDLALIDRQLADLAGEREQREKVRDRLARILQESGSEQHLATLQSALGQFTQAEKRYRQERERAQALRQQSESCKQRLQRETSEAPGFATSSESVEQAQHATNLLASEYKAVRSYLDNLRAAWLARRSAQGQLAQDKATEWRADLARQKAERELVEAHAHLETLERLVDENERSEIAALLTRQQELLTRQQSLPRNLQRAREQRVQAETLATSKQEEFTTASAADELARKVCEQAYGYLLAQFEIYPTEMLLTISQQANGRSHPAIAQDVLGEPFEKESSYQIQGNLEGHLHEEQNKLFKIVSEVNSTLHAYGPQFDQSGIIRFLNAGRVNALELLTRLGEELHRHEQLLEERERELFQNFLLEEMADTVGKHIAEAEQWVARLNAVLSQTAFVGEYYHLTWAPRKQEQLDRGQPVNRLAQYHQILRRQAQTFKEEEIDALVHAFRQEINALGSQPIGTTTFTEALTRILDYRTWFQFELYITRQDRPPQHLTNRFFKKGSGAEQFAMLYIPFFAALSALYESAGAGAPRLIALDEAFEKVSQENTRNLLKFLVSQQFQWIMSGPRVSGEGAAIPACVKYTMFCQKEKELAAGFPSFWSADLPAENH
jgi:Mg2+ and Co2+ transporter CorA